MAERLARLDHARDQFVERFPPLQIAQPRRVRRGDIDREIARRRGEGLHAQDIVGDAVGGVLVGSEIYADDALDGPPREICAPLLEALVVEPQAIDQPRVGAAGETPSAWDCRLAAAASACRLRRNQIRARAEHSGTSAFLSKPAASPSGEGNRSPKASTASRGSREGGAPTRRKFQRRDRGPVRGLRRKPREPSAGERAGGPDRACAHAVKSPKRWRPSSPMRKGARPDNRRQRQRPIEMREQIAAARRLPF